MDKKKLMLILGAMIVALVSAIAMRRMVTGHAAPVVQAAVIVPVSGPRVLIAQRNLATGTIITPDAITYQPWPKPAVQATYFLDGTTDRAKLIGTVVRTPIAAGQPLMQGALVSPGDRGFLAAALAPGMRAVTIPVSDMSGVAGFIFPGDHVDMMLTQTVKSTDTTNPNALPLSLTETVLTNLRVLATDQATETEVTPAGQSVAKIAHNVTLEVTPRVAEKIEVAQTLGTLSLALRSLADTPAETGDMALGNGARTPEITALAGRQAMARIGRSGTGLAGTSYSTGGDVSRFARRALLVSRPARAAFTGSSGPMVSVARGSAVTMEAAAAGGAVAASPPLPFGVHPMHRGEE